MKKKEITILNTDTALLKLIAVITMSIDHIGAILFPQYLIFRIIGRISFPLFAYSTFIGYFKTKDLKKYLVRIIILAVISEPIYLLVFDKGYFSLNVFFAFFCELLILKCLDKKNYYYLFLIVPIMILINVEYAYQLLFFIPIFYYCRYNEFIFSLSLITFYFNFFLSNSIYNSSPSCINGFGLLCLPLILINTKTNIKINKWFYYLFYPVHLLILYAIKCIIFF